MLCSFSQSVQANSEIVPQIVPHLSASAFLTIRYSCLFRRHMTAALDIQLQNNRRKKWSSSSEVRSSGFFHLQFCKNFSFRTSESSGTCRVDWQIVTCVSGERVLSGFREITKDCHEDVSIKRLRIAGNPWPVCNAWYPRRLQYAGHSEKIFLKVKTASFSETWAIISLHGVIFH